MGSNYLAILGVTTVTTVMSCSPAKKEYASFELYPVRTGSLTEMEYTPLATRFYLWSPTAEEVRLMLYDAGEGGHAYETVKMEPTEDGTWTTSVDKNLLGKFYAFNVKINDKWQGDTPGINAHAVGVNGKRAAIIDWKTTNPEGWESDRRPSLKSPADMIIYEMHHRDFSVDSTSGIKNKGKYIKIKYITQLPNTQVPSFVYFANLPQYVKEPYKRFLENKMREKWNLTGTPVNIYIRQK